MPFELVRVPERVPREWALHPDKHIKLTEDKYRDMDPMELVTISG